MGKACLAIWGKRMDFKFSVGCSEKKVFGYLGESNTKKKKWNPCKFSILSNFTTRKKNKVQPFHAIFNMHEVSWKIIIATSLPTHVLYWGLKNCHGWNCHAYASTYRKKKKKKINLSHEIWAMNIILGSILKMKIMPNIQTFLKFICISHKSSQHQLIPNIVLIQSKKKYIVLCDQIKSPQTSSP